MGPAYFVIAILGCADGGVSCTPVATLPAQFVSADECSAAMAAALEANDDLDFPTLVARCRRGVEERSAAAGVERPIPTAARRG